MQIPRYPDTRPLEPADRARFDEAFVASPPEISEFTFTNLYAWREAYGLMVSQDDGFIIVTSTNAATRGFFRPIGHGDLAGVIARLSSARMPFIRIGEKDKDAVVAASGFHAREDRDNADYVYSVRELVELKGKGFDGKRNLIRKFRRLYAYEYVHLDAGAVKECRAFQDFWCAMRDCEGEKSLKDERRAVDEICHNFGLFGLAGGAIRVKDTIVAMAIGQRLNADTMVMHVLKAVPDMPGLYQVMNNEFLAREAGGYEYVNMEQDLGIEGLRKAKLSYHPVRLIPKYKISPQ